MDESIARETLQRVITAMVRGDDSAPDMLKEDIKHLLENVIPKQLQSDDEETVKSAEKLKEVLESFLK